MNELKSPIACVELSINKVLETEGWIRRALEAIPGESAELRSALKDAEHHANLLVMALATARSRSFERRREPATLPRPVEPEGGGSAA